MRSITRAPEERVYGIFGVETPEGRALARIAHDRLVEMGVQPRGVYELSGDLGVAAQHSTNLALRMRQDGVNTVVWAIPYSAIRSSIVLTEAMSTQNYLPEILVGSMGLAFFDQLHNSRVWANARGTSQLPALLARTAIGLDGRESPEFRDMVENADAYVEEGTEAEEGEMPLDAHGMDPVKVLSLARQLGEVRVAQAIRIEKQCSKRRHLTEMACNIRIVRRCVASSK
jgi:hypothetical protein